MSRAGEGRPRLTKDGLEVVPQGVIEPDHGKDGDAIANGKGELASTRTREITIRHSGSAPALARLIHES